MTINGSTNNNNWTYKIEVTETGTNIQNRTSTIQVKTYLGRASSQGYIGGDYTNSVSITGTTTQSQSGNIPYPTYINAGGWYLLKTFTFTVPNTGNPTTVTISSTLNSGAFTPSYASASGTMQLTILHLDPTIETAEIVETNSVLTALSVPNTTIVKYLSKKQITLHATATDSATLSYKLEHTGTDYILPASGFQSSNVFNTDYTANDLTYDANNKARIIQRVSDNLGGQASNWLFVTINGNNEQPDVIPYAKPSIERTTTNIKRKSGGGVNLTDNKATLNLKASFYKNNDVIGNNNSITQIGYKLWASDDTEPASYTVLTPTISGGEITITNFEISNVNFIKVYNYKIKITDAYGYTDEVIDGRIPLGVSVWTEYKDRVDVLRITKQGKDIYPNIYSTTEEIIVGKWINDEPIYRKVIEITTNAGTNNIARSDISANIDIFTKIDGITIQPNTGNIVPISYYYNANDYSNVYISDTNVVIRCGSNYGFGATKIVLEYTKE